MQKYTIFEICKFYEAGRNNGEHDLPLSGDLRGFLLQNPQLTEAYNHGQHIGMTIRHNAKAKSRAVSVIGAVKDDAYQPSHPAYLPSIDG